MIAIYRTSIRITTGEQSTILLAALFLGFIGLVYATYVKDGGLIFDDWSVWNLGARHGHLIDAYKDYFPSFASRPFAPVYYALISRFEGLAAGYIIANLALWCGAVALTALVLRETIGRFFAILFLFLSAIPTFSSTVIFSPAMQSIGSLAIFIWALSFMLLHHAIVNAAPKFVFLSVALCMLVCVTYEVALPLLALSLVLPLLRVDRSFFHTMKSSIFLINTFGILIVVTIMIIYQKILGPLFLPEIDDISRLELTDPADLLAFGSRNLKRLLLISTQEMPLFLIEGTVRLLTDSGAMTIAAWVCSIFLLLAALRSALPIRDLKQPTHLLLFLAAIVVGLFGVLLIHTFSWAEPKIHGYRNRGLSSLSLLLPMMLATTSSLAYILNRWLGRVAIVIAITLFVAQLASFLVQRDNYIAAASVQSDILSDVVEKFDLPSDIASPDALSITPRMVIGNVPEFLLTNFNDETIFSDKVRDWNFAVNLYTEGRLKGVRVSAEKWCDDSRKVVRNDKLIAVDGAIEPITNAWYYEYNLENRTSFLVQIRDEGHLRNVLRSRIDCSTVVPVHPHQAWRPQNAGN